MLLSLVAMLLVAARASSAPVAVPHDVSILASESDLPLEIDEGSDDRCVVARPASDGRAPSGARGLPLGPSWPAAACAPARRSAESSATTAPEDPPESVAVRLHARIMVFLI